MSKILLIALWLAIPAGHAMSFYAAPPLLYLGGGVVPGDWETWEDAMIRFDNQITTIVFHDSGGGDSAAGRKIGNDIRKRGFTTVVSGRCSSACANMFLGGTTRQFANAADKRENVLGYHGSYNKTTKALNTKRTGDYFVEMTGGKMSEEFVARFIKLENKAGLLRFVHRDQRAQSGDPLALLCNGTEERSKRIEQCQRLPDADALTQGVVTTWEQRVIVLPPKPSPEKATFASWRADSNAAKFLEYQGN